MKILHAVHGYPPEFVGGTELYVKRLAEHQGGAGHEVLVVAGSGTIEGHDHEATDSDGTRIHRLVSHTLFHERWDRSGSPQVANRFRAVLTAERPDLVHVHHWLRLCRHLVREAAAAGIPAVITAHDLFTTCPRVFRVRDDEACCERPLGVESCLHCVPREAWMSDETVTLQIAHFVEDMRSELRAAAAIVAPSQAHARVLARFAALDPHALTVIPHGSTVDWVSLADQAPWCADAGRALRVAYWGHLDPVKGVHVLLGAVARLPQPNAVQVVLWGRSQNAEYEARIARLSEGLAVERRPIFRPGDLPALRADVAIFPSLAHESYSLVLDEAFALGLPVFVSDRGALPERCAGGGAAFPPGDEAALAQLLDRAVHDPQFLTTLRRAVPKPTDFDVHWRQLESVYRRALGRATAVPATDPGAEAERWERIARSHEARARVLDGQRAYAEDGLTRARAELQRPLSVRLLHWLRARRAGNA